MMDLAYNEDSVDLCSADAKYMAHPSTVEHFLSHVESTDIRYHFVNRIGE